MSPRTHSLCLRAAVMCLLGAGCTNRGYTIAGGSVEPAQAPIIRADGDTVSARAQPQPTLRARPADALGPEPTDVVVVAHRASSEPGLRELLLARPDGRRVGVLYAPPGGHALPVELDARLQVALVPPDPESEFTGAALVIRDPGGALVAALAAGGGLAPGTLGPDVELSASGRLVYSDARQLPSLCTVATLHYRLRVRELESFRYVEPGTESRLILGATPYQLIVLDVSRPADARCAGETASELSFAVLRLPADSRSAAPDGAVQQEPAPPLSP